MPGALLWQVLLRWVRTANVHVRRVKQGKPSTHPAAGVPRPSQLPGCGALYRAAADAVQEFLALTMKTFVLIVTFAAAGVTDGVRTERIASFDDYQSCVSAGRAMYPHQHWECVSQNQLPQGSTGR